MLNKTFCHLHNHDEFSQLDGFGKAKQYVARAKELGFKYLALTNHGNVDGLIKFQTECDKQGIRPILGCEFYIVPDASIKQKGERRGHITILIKNKKGWQRLCRLLTQANTDGFYYRPRIDYDMLLNCILSDFIILTGCAGSFLNLPGSMEVLKELADRMLHSNALFLEIMPHDIPVQYDINDKVKEIARVMPIPLVATNDCHYIYKDEWETQEVLLAMQRKAKWHDKDRWKFGFKGLHLRTADEMDEAFEIQGQFHRRVYLGAMRNTIKIAKRCWAFRIPKQQIFLPSVPGYDDNSPNKLLGEIVEESRLRIINSGEISEAQVDDYNSRIAEELQIINNKGFAQYFLIVHEVVNWCHANNIMVGPGRGSAGGSLISYLMNITTVDPLKFNLLFSRFIAEDRIDYPDIDLDFEDSKRHLVKQHLEELYGHDNVAGVSTFSKMKARGVIRDVARVFDVPYLEVDAFAKAMPDKINKGAKEDYVIEWATKNIPEGKAFARKYPDVIHHAIKLENQVKNSGRHAAAVIISGDSLRLGERGNICKRNNELVINWEMEDCEHVGLMKLDVLGLNTLSVLSEARTLIKQNRDINIDYKSLPLDDQDVFAMMTAGKTIGLFQLQAGPTTELVKEIEVHKFEDISDIIALVRPGPFDSGSTKEYIKRKQGRRWKPKHEIYERITRNTYGVIVYQEQIMQVINKVAGVSYSTADKIRKIIGKKRDAKEFEQYWQKFLDGCLANCTMDEGEAEDFWAMLEKCASYVFNRSHSIEYAMIGYWTAYLKYHYPAEFICACLTHGQASDKDALIKEARRLGLRLIPPKIGISDARKWMAKEGKLFVPFIEIKGVGDKGAIKCTNYTGRATKNKLTGFFKRKSSAAPQGSTKLDKILHAISAWDTEAVPDVAQQYFDFSLATGCANMYPQLYSFMSFPEEKLADALALNTPRKMIGLIKKKRFHCNEVVECEACELTNECRIPVVSSYGIYNVAIIGEAPGKSEDKAGKGFVGPAGDLLWKIMKPYGYNRRHFHITNICRCWPSNTKTPGKKHIRACMPWLTKELKNLECRLALVFGNTGVKAFTNRDSGITDLNATTEWNEEHGLWICWCVHPAAALRSTEYKEKVEKGVKNFVDKLEILL